MQTLLWAYMFILIKITWTHYFPTTICVVEFDRCFRIVIASHLFFFWGEDMLFMKCQTALFALTTSKRILLCKKRSHISLFICKEKLGDRFICGACINLILLRFYVTAIHLLSNKKKNSWNLHKKVELFATPTHYHHLCALLFMHSHSFKHYLFDFLSIWFERG